MTILENNIIKLRPLEPNDIDLLIAWENDPEIWGISNTITPFSKYILNKFIENSHLDIYETKQFRFVIDLKKDSKTEPIGTIDLFDFDPYHNRIGIGILIKEKQHRQKGYASSTLELVIKYAFDTLLVHQIFCNISENNNTSLSLFKKHDFEIIGLKKDWINTSDGYKNEYLLQLITHNKI